MARNAAQQASFTSRECVHTKNKAGWVGLFADDAIIQDPIGPSYLDESGAGHRGKRAIEAFWDNNIAPAQLTINIHQSYACGNECANHVTINMSFDMDGTLTTQTVNGIFTYLVNNEGKLESLRGYWHEEDTMASMRPVV